MRIAARPGAREACYRLGERLVFVVPRELRAPEHFFGAHWSRKHRERAAWEVALTNAVIADRGAAGAQLILGPHAPLPGCRGGLGAERRRVDVVRLAPSRRHFIRDDDNLAFSLKSLLDALKRLGLIFDDRRAWLDAPPPRQAVSHDGQWWTEISIGPAPAREG